MGSGPSRAWAGLGLRRGRLAVGGDNPFPPTLWTRHCVQLLRTTLHNTTTTTREGAPRDSEFADYASIAS